MLLKIFKQIKFRCIVALACFFFNGVAYGTCTILGLPAACTCTVATTAVSFLNYNPVTGTPITANGNIAVTCTALALFVVSYVIDFAPGNSTPSYSPRIMKLGATNLNYNLYTTAAFTTIWGNNTGGSGHVTDTVTALLLTETTNYTVFGRINPAIQTVGAGTYTDTLVVTVTY